mgnify:FL=1
MRGSAYPTRMIRPLRIAALLLVPVAALAGCSHSDPSSAEASASATDDAAMDASATDDAVTGTPDPATVPTVDTTPVPTTTESEAAVDSGDLSSDELPPQGLDQSAALDDGLNVRIDGIKAADITAGPGEVGGAGIVVSVTVGNSTDAEISLSGLVVNVTYGADNVPASPVESASDTVPASLAAGDASTIEYGFIIPVEERGSVSIIVDSGSQARAAVFQGEAPAS